MTKRIKGSINRIGQAIPSLRIHLAVRIKTGYFCSYNPHPERPVAWRILIFLRFFWDKKSHNVPSKVTPKGYEHTYTESANH